ncbi:MAG: hypothetical protein INR68_08975 [Methylobacterium mesophilicum]|nr:hypothetical protein [Methylobacterium mesophilicum]
MHTFVIIGIGVLLAGGTLISLYSPFGLSMAASFMGHNAMGGLMAAMVMFASGRENAMLWLLAYGFTACFAHIALLRLATSSAGLDTPPIRLIAAAIRRARQKALSHPLFKALVGRDDQ